MHLKDNAGVTDGTIVNADGSVANKPTQLLSAEEARILRLYKKFLERHHMREALFCSHCFEGDLSDGMRAFVRDDQILFECRHRMIYYGGPSY